VKEIMSGNYYAGLMDKKRTIQHKTGLGAISDAFPKQINTLWNNCCPISQLTLYKICGNTLSMKWFLRYLPFLYNSHFYAFLPRKQPPSLSYLVLILEKDFIKPIVIIKSYPLKKTIY